MSLKASVNGLSVKIQSRYFHWTQFTQFEVSYIYDCQTVGIFVMIYNVGGSVFHGQTGSETVWSIKQRGEMQKEFCSCFVAI